MKRSISAAVAEALDKYRDPDKRVQFEDDWGKDSENE